MFTPLITFLSLGNFIVIMVFVYGIIGIIRAIKFKKFDVSCVFSILSVIFGIAVLFLPNILLITDTIILYMTAAWFVLMGIVQITIAVSITKKSGSGLWILQLILAILGILIGIYSFFQPAIMAVSLGVLIGMFFIETGFTLILGGIAIKD